MDGHLYCLQLREHAKIDEPTYKVGKTTNLNVRLSQYPKDSKIKNINSVYNCHLAEKKALNLLVEHPMITHRPDIGKEYFTGDIDIIKNIIMNVCQEVDMNLFTENISCDENTKIEEFKQAFERDFVITNDFKNDYFKATELSKWAEDIGLSVNTAVSINPILKNEYGIDNNNKIWYRQKKMTVITGSEKKPVYCYFGIKKINE